ncbi:MAG: hypothetical protein IKC69_00410, partial [Clostridia bacterium]|nr:hypothetical protein [Clostridia bacterium]
EEVELALQSLKRMKVKSKTVSSGLIELCIETKLTPETLGLVESLSSVSGVVDASAVSYRSDTTL